MSDLYREPRTWDDVKESCGLQDEDTIKELASINFEFFLEHVLGFNTESELIQYLIDITQNPPEQENNKATKIAVEAPRGHSKTYTATIGRSLHVAYTEKRSEIVIVAGSREQSTDILADTKTIISNNEVLQHLEPTVDRVEKLQTDIEKWERTWAAKSITTTTSVKIRTKPFGSTIRGKHIDYVFCDDLLSDESSGHRTRRAEKDMFYNIISPIAENSEGVLQIVGTPQDHNDLMEELMDKPSYESRKFKALRDDGSVLWPYMWTKKQLQAKREEIGPSRFMREYQCVREGTRIITKRGVKKIENIVPGDFVLGESEFTKVNEVFDTNAEELIEIEVARKRNIEITPDHPIKVVKQRYNVKEHDNGFYHIPSKHGYESEWVPASEVERGDIILFPRPNIDNEDYPVSDEALELAGWYITEGHSYDYTNVDCNSWSMGIAQKDKETREYISDLFNKVWDYDAPVGEKETRCFKSRICEYYHFYFGGTSENKTLPEWFHNLSERQFSLLLDVLVDGDGYYSTERDTYKYSTNSEDLAFQLKVLLRKFGYTATMSKIEREESAAMWQIRWCGHESPYIWINEEATYERVTGVERKRGSYNTYNLHTEDNTYTTSEMLVHNCEPMSPEEQFFPESMVRECIDTEGRYWKMTPKESWNYYVGGDIAMSDDSSADYTVFKIIGTPPDEDRYYEVDMYRKKGLGPKQIIDKLEELDERYHFTGGFIERNAIGYGVWRNMENKAIANRVEAFDTTRKTRPTILSELQAALDRRQLALHKDQTTIDELLAFKKRSGKLKGKDHDDTVLALAMAWHAVEDKQSTPVTMSIISDNDEDDIDLFDDGSGDDDDIEIGII